MFPETLPSLLWGDMSPSRSSMNAKPAIQPQISLASRRAASCVVFMWRPTVSWTMARVDPS